MVNLKTNEDLIKDIKSSQWFSIGFFCLGIITTVVAIMFSHVLWFIVTCLAFLLGVFFNIERNSDLIRLEIRTERWRNNE
jgi:hypothetical protein